MPPGQAAGGGEAEVPRHGAVRLRGGGERGVRRGELLVGHPGAVVAHRQQHAAALPRAGGHDDRGRARGEGAFGQLGEEVGHVPDGLARHDGVVPHVHDHALAVGHLGERGAHHLGQRGRAAGRGRRLLAGGEQQVLAGAPHAVGEAAEPYQGAEPPLVVLAPLQLGEEQALVLGRLRGAAGQVAEQRGDVAAEPLLLGGEPCRLPVQLVEGPRELADLAAVRRVRGRGLGRGGARPVAGGPHGRGVQPPQRAGEGGGDEAGDQQRQREQQRAAAAGDEGAGARPVAQVGGPAGEVAGEVAFHRAELLEHGGGVLVPVAGVVAAVGGDLVQVAAVRADQAADPVGLGHPLATDRPVVPGQGGGARLALEQGRLGQLPLPGDEERRLRLGVEPVRRHGDEEAADLPGELLLGAAQRTERDGVPAEVGVAVPAELVGEREERVDHGAVAVEGDARLSAVAEGLGPQGLDARQAFPHRLRLAAEPRVTAGLEGREQGRDPPCRGVHPGALLRDALPPGGGGVGEVPGGEGALGTGLVRERAEPFGESGDLGEPPLVGPRGDRADRLHHGDEHRHHRGQQDQGGQPGTDPPAAQATTTAGARTARHPRGIARGAAATLGVGLPHWLSHPLAGPDARPAVSLARSLARRTGRP